MKKWTSFLNSLIVIPVVITLLFSILIKVKIIPENYSLSIGLLIGVMLLFCIPLGILKGLDTTTRKPGFWFLILVLLFIGFIILKDSLPNLIGSF